MWKSKQKVLEVVSLVMTVENLPSIVSPLKPVVKHQYLHILARSNFADHPSSFFATEASE